MFSPFRSPALRARRAAPPPRRPEPPVEAVASHLPDTRTAPSQRGPSQLGPSQLSPSPDSPSPGVTARPGGPAFEPAYRGGGDGFP